MFHFTSMLGKRMIDSFHFPTSISLVEKGSYVKISHICISTQSYDPKHQISRIVGVNWFCSVISLAMQIAPLNPHTLQQEQRDKRFRKNTSPYFRYRSDGEYFQNLAGTEYINRIQNVVIGEWVNNVCHTLMHIWITNHNFTRLMY